VEGDPLDQPGDFLGRWSALWDRGIHAWESFFHGRYGIWQEFRRREMVSFLSFPTSRRSTILDQV
jgi:hypothetical protein